MPGPGAYNRGFALPRTGASRVTTASFLAFGLPGGQEWLVILLVVLVFFGKRIPGVARSLGSGINEFKKGLRDGDSKADDDEPERLGGGGKETPRLRDGED